MRGLPLPLDIKSLIDRTGRTDKVRCYSDADIFYVDETPPTPVGRIRVELIYSRFSQRDLSRTLLRYKKS